jgi:hypothetical protein
MLKIGLLPLLCEVLRESLMELSYGGIYDGSWVCALSLKCAFAAGRW